MMIYGAIIAVALAGAATAYTPLGFEPASSDNLTVAFGDVLASNGDDLPRDVTASAPTVGTAERLSGSYTIMMVDPDIPPQVAGHPTSELLHWLQAGLVSSNTSTTVGGQTFYELINPTNTSAIAIASYLQPSPPNKSPVSHRYTQLLLNTTGNSSALSTLTQAGMTRQNFSAVDVLKSAGLTVLQGNWFNVTNANATSGNAPGGNSTTTSSGSQTASMSVSESTLTITSVVPGNPTSAPAGPTTTTPGAASSTNAGSAERGGAVIAGLGAIAALVAML